jgi:hypothetical protein
MINTVKLKYNRLIWIIAISLLLANGIHAMATGYTFIIHPVWNLRGLTIAYLTPSSLHNFFMPGILLFLILGFMSIIISIIALLKGTFYPFLISLQGVALFVWTLSQIIFLGFLHPMLIVIGVISIMLIPMGYFLKDFKR